MADKIVSLADAINQLVPALESLGRVGIPLAISMLLLGGGGYLCWKLPPIVAKIVPLASTFVTLLDNNTAIVNQATKAMEAITFSIQEHRREFAPHHENAKAIQCDLDGLLELAGTINVTMAKEAHIAGLHTSINTIKNDTTTIKTLLAEHARQKGAVVIDSQN